MVLDAKCHAAIVGARDSPHVDRIDDVAEVQVPGGGRREPRAPPRSEPAQPEGSHSARWREVTPGQPRDDGPLRPRPPPRRGDDGLVPLRVGALGRPPFLAAARARSSAFLARITAMRSASGISSLASILAL